MPDLRPGDRVLSVGWDGQLAFEELFLFTHFDPSLVAAYKTVTAVAAGEAGTTHQLKLSFTHYMAAAHDPSGACAALAAAGASPTAQQQTEWTAAAQRLDWARDHEMSLARQLSPGMVAWLADASGRAAPACIVATNATVAAGAFTPFVRARGIVVDGVVASQHVRNGRIWGRSWLPASTDPHIPAVMEVLYTPYFWLYKVLGPKLVWRINQHPIFGTLNLGNIVLSNLAVWGHVVLALAVAASVARCAVRATRATGKLKAE